MGLNIKDPEAHELAQAIARVTGESMTRAVTEALRERYARIKHRRTKASVEELLVIADRAAEPCEATLPLPCRSSLRSERPAEMILDTSAVVAGS